jgi:hypothetical protein
MRSFLVEEVEAGPSEQDLAVPYATDSHHLYEDTLSPIPVWWIRVHTHMSESSSSFAIVEHYMQQCWILSFADFAFEVEIVSAAFTISVQA